MKVFLISHISDPDGITPLILSHLVYEEVEHLLLEASEVDTSVLNLINDDKLSSYDIIYITDLMLSDNLYKIINENIKLKDKIKIFDHHIGSLFAKDYSFATIVDTNDNGGKESASSLFYKYLSNISDCKYLKTDAIKDFVELVKLYDTWEWKEKNDFNAKKLADLFTIYGKDYFFKYYLNYFKEHNTFSFSDKEEFLLEIEDMRIKNYIEDKKKKIITVNYLNHKVGVVFASRYRSELGNTLADYFKEKYDFIVIVSMEGNISYRGIKDVNLNEVAALFGGGGHKNAAGSPMPKDLQTKLIKIIFNDNFIIENNI